MNEVGYFSTVDRVFTGLNVNAQGWARRGTEHTGGAAWRAIFFAHQAMAPAIALRDVGGLFRVLLRDRMALAQTRSSQNGGGHRHPRKISGIYNFCQNVSGCIEVYQSLSESDHASPSKWQYQCGGVPERISRD